MGVKCKDTDPIVVREDKVHDYYRPIVVCHYERFHFEDVANFQFEQAEYSHRVNWRGPIYLYLEWHQQWHQHHCPPERPQGDKNNQRSIEIR